MRKLALTALITFTILLVYLTGSVLYVFLHGITPDLVYPESFQYWHYDPEHAEITITIQDIEEGPKNAGGKSSLYTKVKEGDRIYDNLLKLLENNPNGWKPDLATYVPIHMFSSKNLNVNVLEGGVVINYSAIPFPGHIQISKRINALDLLLDGVMEDPVR